MHFVVEDASFRTFLIYIENSNLYFINPLTFSIFRGFVIKGNKIATTDHTNYTKKPAILFALKFRGSQCQGNYLCQEIFR